MLVDFPNTSRKTTPPRASYCFGTFQRLLEIVARRLLNSASIVTGEDATMPSGNPFQALCTLVVEDRLSAAEGGSDSEWYLLRSPSFAPTREVEV